jgi:hypothetical protein
MQARYYDPVIGRFYSNDPVGFVGDSVHSFNRYAYANNNPFRYVDPDGKYPESAEEWGNFAKGLGKVAQTGFQALAGVASVAIGSADLLIGSKFVGTAMVTGGLYAIADSKYTGMDAANTLKNAWNNTSASDNTVIAEGPVQAAAMKFGASQEIVEGAGNIDKVLGMATGNISGTAAKTLDVGQGIKKASDASKLADKADTINVDNN